MGFFKDLNFPRSVILASVLTSGVLGWFVYKGSQRLEAVQREALQAPKVVTEIHENAFGVENLNRLKGSDEALKKANDVEFLVRTIGKQPTSALGQLELTTVRRGLTKDLEDVIYQIRPSDKNEDFNRLTIGNFLYQLEKTSKLLRVTHIKLDPAQRLKPGEIGNDRWKFDIEVSSRRSVQG